MTASERTKLKQFWFVRWITLCYAGEVSFNEVSGNWYAEQLAYFNKVVYRNYLKQAKEKNDLERTLRIINHYGKKL